MRQFKHASSIRALRSLFLIFFLTVRALPILEISWRHDFFLKSRLLQGHETGSVFRSFLRGEVPLSHSTLGTLPSDNDLTNEYKNMASFHAWVRFQSEKDRFLEHSCAQSCLTKHQTSKERRCVAIFFIFGKIIFEICINFALIWWYFHLSAICIHIALCFWRCNFELRHVRCL